MQPLIQIVRRHAGRTAEFLVAAGALLALQAVDHDLATGAITVPTAWQPFVPFALGAGAVGASMLGPQVVRLRAAALAADPADPKLDGIAAQIAGEVKATIGAIPIPAAPAAVTDTVAAKPVFPADPTPQPVA